MRVLVLGASGIIGQHMMAKLPESDSREPNEFLFCRKQGGGNYYQADLTDESERTKLLREFRPNVIVNLAGESRPDAVEADPDYYWQINIELPLKLAQWTGFSHDRHLIHTSTQAVFAGLEAPYRSDSVPSGVNAYGQQKRFTDKCLRLKSSVTIIRPTFVLGIRPDPTIGRPNPVELMLGGQKQQVNDRWFSPSFAPDVAQLIWDVCRRKPSGEVIHAGVPIRTNRYEIAMALGCDAVPVSHEDFPGIAPRPFDTTYADGARYGMNFQEGIADCLARWRRREKIAA